MRNAVESGSASSERNADSSGQRRTSGGADAPYDRCSALVAGDDGEGGRVIERVLDEDGLGGWDRDGGGRGSPRRGVAGRRSEKAAAWRLLLSGEI
jgi:hypothetical protein